ncbi:MAG: class II glutamine amidotransferase [Brachybacterium sp.]|nr:class II glutamine amidotransferase [Brachybacterium sp.]
MCRLLGVLTRDETPLVDAVPDELPLFTALSERHKDGWGVAWYPRPGEESLGAELSGATGEPQVRRGTDTALASTGYGEATREAYGPMMLVHLRRASPGLVLSLENTHPFLAGPVAFAHNGQFDLTARIRSRILDHGGRQPLGTTDSELFFSLITAHAPELGWARATQYAAAELTAITREEAGRVPESLNCLLMTPGALVAYAQADPAQAPPDQPREVYDLRVRVDPERVIVSSSGYDQNGSTTLGRELPAIRPERSDNPLTAARSGDCVVRRPFRDFVSALRGTLQDPHRRRIRLNRALTQ